MSTHISEEYLDGLVRDIIAGAVASGADVDVADWVTDLQLLANIAGEVL